MLPKFVSCLVFIALFLSAIGQEVSSEPPIVISPGPGSASSEPPVVITLNPGAGEEVGDLKTLGRVRIDSARLPSHCTTDETVKVGFTDLGFCGQDYAQANCWRALRAPPGARIQVNVQNVKQPEARSFDVFDQDGEQWFKVGMIRDGEFYPPEGIKSRQGRMCVHFETTISMRESEQSMTYEFV